MTTRPHRLSDRAFGLTFTGVFLFIAFVGWLFFDKVMLWPVFCAVLFGTVALARPGILMPLNRLWYRIAMFLMQCTNFIVLIVSFCVVIIPIGFIMKLLKYDPMCREFDKNKKSYWEPVKRQNDRETFHDIF